MNDSYRESSRERECTFPTLFFHLFLERERTKRHILNADFRDSRNSLNYMRHLPSPMNIGHTWHSRIYVAPLEGIIVDTIKNPVTISMRYLIFGPFLVKLILVRTIDLFKT